MVPALAPMCESWSMFVGSRPTCQSHIFGKYIRRTTMHTQLHQDQWQVDVPEIRDCCPLLANDRTDSSYSFVSPWCVKREFVVVFDGEVGVDVGASITVPMDLSTTFFEYALQMCLCAARQEK